MNRFAIARNGAIGVIAFTLAAAAGTTESQAQFEDAIMIGPFDRYGLDLSVGDVVSLSLGGNSSSISVRDPETGVEVSVGGRFPAALWPDAAELFGEDEVLCLEFEASVAFEYGLIESATLTHGERYYGSAIYSVSFDNEFVSALQDRVSEQDSQSQDEGPVVGVGLSVELCPQFNAPLLLLPVDARRLGDNPRQQVWTRMIPQPMALSISAVRGAGSSFWRSTSVERPPIRFPLAPETPGTTLELKLEVSGEQFCLNEDAGPPVVGPAMGSDEFVHFPLEERFIDMIAEIINLSHLNAFQRNNCLWAAAHAIDKRSIFPSMLMPELSRGIHPDCRAPIGLSQGTE